MLKWNFLFIRRYLTQSENINYRLGESLKYENKFLLRRFKELQINIKKKKNLKEKLGKGSNREFTEWKDS